MAIPEGRLSSEPVEGRYIGAASFATNDLLDYEDGGIGIQDPSEGLNYQRWMARVINGGTGIALSADNTPEFTLIEGEDITHVALAFDSNMRPVVAFVDGGMAKLYWYDTSVSENVITEYPNIQNPRLTTDDKRAMQSGIRDVIFAYQRNGGLYYRQQRDRYQAEYLLQESAPGVLKKVGMTNRLRLQFEFELPTVEPKVMLDVSGNTRTWDMNQNWRSMGKKGEYDTRVIWRRLGQHRSFTPRIAISAPVKRAIFAAHADIRPQRS